MSFTDIQGQDQPIQRLKRAISQNQLPGSYLFVGPEGVGKKMTAETLAKTLNCQNETQDACDTCISCLKIEKHQHPDVHCIDSENSELIKIESIRQLHREINLKPYEGKTKVFIIDNAHKLTAEAANALLKILEEPPRDSLIILVSAKPALLFKTIISRCQVLKFYPTQRIELEEILKKDYGLDNYLAHFLAYFSEGRLGCALRLKDTETFQEKNRIIDALAFAQGTSHKPDSQNLLGQDKEGLRRSLNVLASWFRDIYLVKVGMPHSELINLDRKTQILRSMSHYTLFDLDEILNSIANALLWLEQNVNMRLLISHLRWSLKGS